MISSCTKDVDDIRDDKFSCKFCKSQELGKLYYNTTLICRENPYSNALLKIHLSTFDNQGANFFGMPPVDLYRNSNEYQKMKEVVRRLTDKECYVQVLVEAIPTGLNETDRVYRIIGEYNNNLA